MSRIAANELVGLRKDLKHCGEMYSVTTVLRTREICRSTTTTTPLVPASTANSQTLAFAKPYMSALEFSFISTSSRLSRSGTFLFCHLASFRPSTEVIVFHQHSELCREPDDSQTRFRDGRQDGRHPLDSCLNFQSSSPVVQSPSSLK